MADTKVPAIDVNAEADPETNEVETEADIEIDDETNKETDIEGDKETDKRADIGDNIESYEEFDKGIVEETNKEIDTASGKRGDPGLDDEEHKEVNDILKDVSHIHSNGKEMENRHTVPLKTNKEREDISALSLPAVPNTVTPTLSITGILNDVEFEPTSKTPLGLTPAWDDTIISTQRSMPVRSKRKKEIVKLPNISSSRDFRKTRKRRPVRKRISNSPPKHYYEYRYILNNRIRLTKVYTRPPKYAQILKSEANYIRMSRIIVKLGTMLLRDVLRTYIDRLYPPKDLHQFLQHYKRRLISFASTQKLLQNRWHVLFDDGSYDVELKDLDPALVFWFLRYVCHFKKQTDLIWKLKPAGNDLSVAADIARIRDMRNGLLNASSYSLYDEEYDRKVEEFKSVMERLSTGKRLGEMTGIMDEIKSYTVKVTDRDHNVDILRKWAEETKDRYIDKIAPSKQDWETVKECKAMTQRFLKRLNRSKVFIKTKFYQESKQKLLSNGFVIIKGNTGEGKTTTALAAMAALYEEDEVLVVSSPQQWKYINKHTVGAILFDDLLGSMHFEEKELNDWQGYFDEMCRGCSAKKGVSTTPRNCEICSSDRKDRACAKVIITMRKHVFDHCWPTLSKYKLFAQENVVVCDSTELTFSEKRSILSKHIVADHRIRTEVDKSAKLPISKLGFPESCALFVSQEAYLDLGSQFFERPIEILQHSLDDLYNKDMYGYLTLVVMMFQPGGALFTKRLEEFTNEGFRKQMIDMAGVCDVPVSANLPALCLMSLANTLKPYVYYYETIGCYTFVHESVLEIMMSMFVERHPEHVLETCALQFIMDYVSTSEKFGVPRDQIFMMRMKKHRFLLLAQLFDHYMSYGQVTKIAQHRALRNPQFLTFFINYIKNKDSVHDVILRVDSSEKEKDNFRRVGFLYGAVDQEKPNVELAIAILKLGCHVDGSVNAEWCLSELRSSLCVAVKRGNFALYEALVATKIDIPDKLLTEKEYLTSIDIVSNILWRRPWSKEQKDIALVKASRLTSLDGSDIVSLLLQHDASVSSIRCGTTALCEAVKAGNAKTVSILLMCGASIFDRDMNDQSPLHHACDWNRIETARLLIQKGADVNTKDTSGLSPFLIAAGWGRDEIMQMILAKRVDPLSVDEFEHNFLHICAANGRTGVMNAVMSRFPDEIKRILIARNKFGWTPLDFAIKCGHLGVTKLLVRTILQIDKQKPGHRAFVHTRFNIVKPEDLDQNEKCLQRFVNVDLEKVCFQIPRGKWYIEAGTQEDYNKVVHFVSKYEDRLKLRFAKS